MNFFCHLPWTAVQIDHIGCAPCCMYQPSDQSETKTLGNYLQSKELAEVKSLLLDGKEPKQCQRCVDSEKLNGHSFRVLHNKFHNGKTQEILTTKEYNKNPMELHVLTSNTCNLLCLPCTSKSSYIREVELNKLGLKRIIPVHFRKNSVLDEIHKFDFENITFLGGEPFGDKVTFECLQNLVEQKKSKNITLDLNTNGTLITQEKMDFLSKNFKFIYIKASIDGIGQVNDYLRYPSVWQDLEPRILLTKNYPNVELLVTTALSNLSLMRYYQVIEWTIKNSIKDIFLSPVSIPTELKIVNLPTDIKNDLLKIYQDLKKNYSEQLTDQTNFAIDTCINSCQDVDKNDFSKSINWVQRHDQHRGTNLLDIFPELEPYV
jgi:hypothetical protein